MPNVTTLGLKADDALRDRLKTAASRLSCTSHALHKQALISYLERIERGELPQPFGVAPEQEPNESTGQLAGPVNVFEMLSQDVQPQSVLRQAITAAYRQPEADCVPLRLALAHSAHPERIKQTAQTLVKQLRARQNTSGVDALIHAFSLSTQEGVALMCLAEALLRIPDQATRDALIRDKISHGHWRAHLGQAPSLFVNAATWGLMLTGKLVALNSEKSLSAALTRLIGKGGEPLIRKSVDMAMRLLGEQFVCGQDIAQALKTAAREQKKGFRYSFDMLGEAALTAEDAAHYLARYEQAIHAIGQASDARGIYDGHGISIKLSALHPRYQRAQRRQVMTVLYPRLRALTELARQYDIGINIDAEEADRLDLSLDLLERLVFEPSLAGWHGIGVVVQAYQKRALPLIDYLMDLAARSQRRLMVRLVKGAYWDTEIKRAQVDGLEDYPVFTRKVHTDVSYLACARRMLSQPQAIFSQFATHNAQTVAAIIDMAGLNYYRGQYEFQCLHGMGEPLFEQVIKPVSEGGLDRPCRIYAPVGSHETLLPYLVRRLLENGANSSFVNLIHDNKIPVEQLTQDPVVLASTLEPIGSPHPKIPKPTDLFRTDKEKDLTRLAASGLDLSHETRLASLAAALNHSRLATWHAQPQLRATDTDPLTLKDDNAAHTVLNPADQRDVVGTVRYARPTDVETALARAEHASQIWQGTPLATRANYLKIAADRLEERMPLLMGLIIREAGKTIPNAIGEVREAVDFLRFYAAQAPHLVIQKTGTTPDALGVVVCISPWNFPLAIFIGQISAALVAGNVVIAKPAEQTSLIAAQAVEILYESGVPEEALQCLPGDGETVGQPLVADPRVQGVLFTGSNQTAQRIQETLAQRLNADGQPVRFVAETGGINALIADSSALPEQVVADVITSAFDAAGQRCSALRLLYLQADTADTVIPMLKGAMRELIMGNPADLATDIGPVIDSQAMRMIDHYIAEKQKQGHAVFQTPRPAHCARGTFVQPTLIEVGGIADVPSEVFGPVLHVATYDRGQREAVMRDLNATGYGLTFGVHTRIDEASQQLTQASQAGNLYVNRNIIGASVGVQPFGGQGLSGTGPKAGGPLYLLHLLRESETKPVFLQSPVSLQGPTGESNQYWHKPRGRILCIFDRIDTGQAMLSALKITGNTPIFEQKSWAKINPSKRPTEWATIEVLATDDLGTAEFAAVLFEGDADKRLELLQRLARRSGAIVPLQVWPRQQSTDATAVPLCLVHEVSLCVNTAAAGGNASLMTLA